VCKEWTLNGPFLLIAPAIFAISGRTSCAGCLLRKYTALTSVFLHIQVVTSSDFPDGEGESEFIGRADAEDIQTSIGRQMLGLEPFAETSGSSVIHESNKILF
jgi:hypothetical protein